MKFIFKPKHTLPAAVLAAGCCLCCISYAGERAPAEVPAQHAAHAAPAAFAFADEARHGVPVAELDRARGGADTTIVDTRLSTVVGGNSANQVQTGWNVINGGAFANLTGIPVVIQNSGANVAIQNATVIELQFK